MYISMYTSVRMHAYMYLCMFVCFVWVCMSVFKYFVEYNSNEVVLVTDRSNMTDVCR